VHYFSGAGVATTGQSKSVVGAGEAGATRDVALLQPCCGVSRAGAANFSQLIRIPCVPVPSRNIRKVAVSEVPPHARVGPQGVFKHFHWEMLSCRGAGGLVCRGLRNTVGCAETTCCLPDFPSWLCYRACQHGLLLGTVHMHLRNMPRSALPHRHREIAVALAVELAPLLQARMLRQWDSGRGPSQEEGGGIVAWKGRGGAQ
jgi:hypothetical protein